MEDSKIYCFSHQYLKYIDKLPYTPVGLTENTFPKNWLRDKSGEKNISYKNSFYDMYTFHYWFWKNEIMNITDGKWIGFCTYRRFWSRSSKVSNSISQNFFDKVLRIIPHEWNDYDVVLSEPLVLKKIKFMKVLKSNFFFYLKNPSFFFGKDHTIKTHFEIFHDSEILKKAINLLSSEEKDEFMDYLNTSAFHPWNLFFCKSKKLLNVYYERVFDWLFRCEKVIGLENLSLKGYKTQRIYAYLAERYLSYWFTKNSKFTTWPIIFLDKNEISKIENSI